LPNLMKVPAGADTVLGEIGPDRRAPICRKRRTLRRRYPDALLFPLFLDFTHSSFLCLAQLIEEFEDGLEDAVEDDLERLDEEAA
jgi:hypothetical protein